MQREDCVEMFERIPAEDHCYVNFVMKNHAVISVDQVARFEKPYVVVRGREGGTSDEDRAFFVPYDEIGYIRIERVVKMSELKEMFGDMSHVDLEDRLAQREETPKAASLTDTPLPLPMPSAPTDPASIAKQNLLDRIRAARNAVAGSATGRLDKR
jgi:hypothetical protein